MKLTRQKLKWYDAITEECQNLAVEFNEVIKTYGDLHIDAGAEVYIEDEGIAVTGDYMSGCGCCYEHFYLSIPFEFMEDREAWIDQWEEDKQQRLLDAIQEKVDDKKKKEEALEVHDRAEYERLKEKYESC